MEEIFPPYEPPPFCLGYILAEFQPFLSMGLRAGAAANCPTPMEKYMKKAKKWIKMAISPKRLIVEQNGENFLLAMDNAGWQKV